MLADIACFSEAECTPQALSAYDIDSTRFTINFKEQSISFEDCGVNLHILFVSLRAFTDIMVLSNTVKVEASVITSDKELDFNFNVDLLKS